MPQKIVITGVSKGLGRALVEEFIELGHVVAGCARNKAEIDNLQQSMGSQHHFAVCDLADDAQVATWSKAVLSDFGTPHLLINNAGIINENAPLWDVTAEEFRKVIDVNLNGVHSVIRHLLPAMMQAGEGVVANLSSGWGRSTSPEVVPYCASKWAIEGLSKGLADELPAGMASVPVNPGVIDTEMLRSCFGEGAAMSPKASAWAKTAAPFFLKLGPRDNGQSVTCP